MALGASLTMIGAGVVIGVGSTQGWGPFGSPTKPPLTASQRKRVAVVGDSLTAQASWAISDSLSTAGHTPVVAGVNGATIGDAQMQIASYVGYNGAQVMVVALGTNNAFFARAGGTRVVDAAATANEITATANRTLVADPSSNFPLSVKCLVWILPNEKAIGFDLQVNAPLVNQAIRAELERRTNDGSPVVIADWTAKAAGRPEWFVSDGVHLTDAGQQAYAELITDAVGSCPAQ